MRNPRALAAGILSVCLVSFCPTASAQSGPSPKPPPAQSEAPQDALRRGTPRGTVMGFLRAARSGDDEVAAQYLNTRLRGQAAAVLAHQLFTVLDRRLPAGLAQLSDRAEGAAPHLTKLNQNLIGTISSEGGNVDIVIERVDRGTSGLIWLFSGDTLSAVPRLYKETEGTAVENVIPKFLVETQIAQIPLFEWLAVFVGMPLLYVFTALLSWLLSPLAGHLLRRLPNRQDSPNPKVLPIPLRLLIMALMIRWALSNITLPLLARTFWFRVAFVITLAGCVWMLILLTRWCERLLRQRLKRLNRGEAAVSLLRLGRTAVNSILILVGVLAGLSYLGVDVTAALAGIGVGGIAIALAAQKTLENVIGGISVACDRAVRVGELVKVGDQRGFVERIGLRSTRIRTFDRTVVSIPNGQLANVSIETISVRDKFWFHHTLSLCRDASASMMRTILDGVESLLTQDPRVETDSLRARFLGFGTSSLDVEIFAYVRASDWSAFLKTQQDLLLAIMEIVQAAGARLAYPSQTVYFDRSNAPGEDALPEATTDSSAHLQDVR